MTFFEASSRSSLLVEHDLFRPAFARRSTKPLIALSPRLRAGGKRVSTFRDHALRLTFRLDALGRRSLGGALGASIHLREDHILIHGHIAADAAVDGRVPVEVGIDRIEGLGGSQAL